MNSSCRAWHPFVLDAGGACGFKNVNLPPFSAMTSCGNEPLFKDGKGCGSCYQVRVVHFVVFRRGNGYRSESKFRYNCSD